MDVWKCNKPSNLGECSHRFETSMMIVAVAVVVVLMFVIYNRLLAWLAVVGSARETGSEQERWFIGYGWTLARRIIWFGFGIRRWLIRIIDLLCIRLTASIFGVATDEWRWKIIDNFAVFFCLHILVFWMEHIFYVLYTRSHFFRRCFRSSLQIDIQNSTHTISDISLLFL